MIKRLSIALLIVNLTIHAIAWIAHYLLNGTGLAAYGNSVVLTSLAVAFVGGAFVSAPSAAGQMQRLDVGIEPNAQEHELSDRRSAVSLGLVVFFTALIGIATGYVMMKFA